LKRACTGKIAHVHGLEESEIFILPEITDKFNAIPTKIPMTFSLVEKLS
jgi:hypothetical protein